MNNLQQSKSVGRLFEAMPIQNLNGVPSPARIIRHNNHHRANMTTLETDLGKSINRIYKEKLGIKSMSKISQSMSSRTPREERKELTKERVPLEVRPLYEIPDMHKANSRNQKLERCVTAPTLQTIQQVQTQKQEERKFDEAPRPPKAPCKQRSNCCEIVQNQTNKKSLSR
jgi:hypothetical protein